MKPSTIGAGVLLVMSQCISGGVTAQGVEGIDPLLKVAPITPERVAPLGERPQPDVATVEGKATYLQYSYVSDQARCVPILVTRLPNPHKRRPAGPTPTWNIWQLAHYDADSRTLRPLNGPEPSGCLGGCPGSVSLMIINRFNAPLRYPQAVYKDAQDDVRQHIAQRGDCLFTEPEFGFKYKVGLYYGVKCDSPDDRYKRKFTFDKEYFYNVDNNTDVKEIYECGPNTPYPHCTGHVSLPGSGGIDIKFTFRRQELPQWRNIQAAAIAYVSRVVEDVVPPPGCPADGRR
jgi:hypothetical protein